MGAHAAARVHAYCPSIHRNNFRAARDRVYDGHRASFKPVTVRGALVSWNNARGGISAQTRRRVCLHRRRCNQSPTSAMTLLRFLHISQEYEVSPQAIFWRPIRYFATEIRNDEDELDAFEVASFAIGNQICFELRWYHGHPAGTVTAYLPF